MKLLNQINANVYRDQMLYHFELLRQITVPRNLTVTHAFHKAATKLASITISVKEWPPQVISQTLRSFPKKPEDQSVLGNHNFKWMSQSATQTPLTQRFPKPNATK